MKKLLLANAAIAQGAYEAGVKVLSAYPGTPSTEIAENFAKFNNVYAEWAPNEKVALEVAVGASLAGARSMACMKHVGLNVAADPLFTLAYTGVNAGLVVVVADDPGMHSSQNEQDTRGYGKIAHVPVLEPSDSTEAKEFVKIAMETSEEYDTPVILRTTTRIAHSQSFVDICERKELELKPYVKDVSKNVMYPASAKKRHVKVEERENRLKKDCESFVINKVEYKSKKLGVVCAGVIYQYVNDVLPNASIFKLGMVYPLPINKIKEFASEVEELLIIEENEPFIETELKANGIVCHGRDVFSVQGEITPATIKERYLKLDVPKQENLPMRPPIMCAGCPHRGVFHILSKLKTVVIGDVGCYTLGASAPLSAMDSMLCMGASLGMAHGFDKAIGNSKNTVGIIGDSTFIHSGITGLINAVYNQSSMTLIILDNSTTGMTGHQDHPATGKTLQGKATSVLNLVDLCHACGVKRVSVVNCYDLENVEKTIKEETNASEVSVIIAQMPCAMIVKERKSPLQVVDCKGCMACSKIGCPAIVIKDKKAQIDQSQCVGCGLCKKVCKFGCIK